MKMLQIKLESLDEDLRWTNGTATDVLELRRMACQEARELGMEAVSAVTSDGMVKLFETDELGGPSADVDELIAQGVLIPFDASGS